MGLPTAALLRLVLGAGASDANFPLQMCVAGVDLPPPVFDTAPVPIAACEAARDSVVGQAIAILHRSGRLS